MQVQLQPSKIIYLRNGNKLYSHENKVFNLSVKFKYSATRRKSALLDFEWI